MRLERAERLFERRARIDSMQLVEIDALELEAAQAHLDTLNQVAGAAHVLGFGRALARDAALGGDDDARRVRRKRFADQALGDLRAVGVGGVDERDAELDGAAQNAAAFGGVGRLAPRAIAHQAHGSVAEAVHRQVAADEKGAARSGREIRRSHHLSSMLSPEMSVGQCGGHKDVFRSFGNRHPSRKDKDPARVGHRL